MLRFAMVAALFGILGCGGEVYEPDEESNVAGQALRYPCGDVNFDGRVTVTDAVIISNLAATQKWTTAQYYNADVNSDLRVTVTDSVIVQRVAAGLAPASSLKCQTTAIGLAPLPGK